MPQYKSKQEALNSFRRYFCRGILTEPKEGQDFSYAEIYIVEALWDLETNKCYYADGHVIKFIDHELERAYVHLKSIAKSAGLYPIPEEMEEAIEVKRRMGRATAEIRDKRKYAHCSKKNRKNFEVIMGPLPRDKIYELATGYGASSSPRNKLTKSVYG